MSNSVPKSKFPKGTIRQERISKLLGEGKMVYEIAEIMGVSEKTIRRDIKKYVEKLPEQRDVFVKQCVDTRIWMLREITDVCLKTKDAGLKCKAMNVRRRIVQDFERFIARFGFVPSEKDDREPIIPHGYVNMTEILMNARKALDEEKDKVLED